MMSIIVTGPKGSGKSTIGAKLGELMQVPVVETDDLLEQLFEREKGQSLPCREICRRHGEKFFRQLERRAAAMAFECDDRIICTGGQTLLDEETREIFRQAGKIIFIKVPFDTIWKRVERRGMPPFFPKENPRQWFKSRVLYLEEVVGACADLVFTPTHFSAIDNAKQLLADIKRCQL